MATWFQEQSERSRALFALACKCALSVAATSRRKAEAPVTPTARVRTHFTCLKRALFILNIVVFPPITLPRAASGVMTRLECNFFALMYAQTAFTIAPVAILDLPVMAARAELSVRGLKTPVPFAFIFAAVFFPDAIIALPM